MESFAKNVEFCFISLLDVPAAMLLWNSNLYTPCPFFVEKEKNGYVFSFNLKSVFRSGIKQSILLFVFEFHLLIIDIIISKRI